MFFTEPRVGLFWTVAAGPRGIETKSPKDGSPRVKMPQEPAPGLVGAPPMGGMSERNAFDNRGERIRTSDLIVPNDARYQAAPHPEKNTTRTVLNPIRIKDVGRGWQGKSRLGGTRQEKNLQGKLKHAPVRRVQVPRYSGELPPPPPVP